MTEASEKSGARHLTAQEREAAKWEFMILEADNIDNMETWMNDRASEGWELANYNVVTRTESNGGGIIKTEIQYTALFKRYRKLPKRTPAQIKAELEAVAEMNRSLRRR